MQSRLEASRPTGVSPAGSTNTESLSGPQTATILGFTAPPLNEQSYVARSSNCVHIVPLLVPISEQIVGLSIRIVISGAEFRRVPRRHLQTCSVRPDHSTTCQLIHSTGTSQFPCGERHADTICDGRPGKSVGGSALTILPSSTDRGPDGPPSSGSRLVSVYEECRVYELSRHASKFSVSPCHNQPEPARTTTSRAHIQSFLDGEK